jgi:transposase
MLGIMHSLNSEFHELFEKSKYLGEEILNLMNWLNKAQLYYRNSVATIRRWFAEVVGYFEKRTTNGIVEIINNKLKLLKRCGFGFRNFNNFKIRALLFWHYPNI